MRTIVFSFLLCLAACGRIEASPDPPEVCWVREIEGGKKIRICLRYRDGREIVLVAELSKAGD